MTEIKSIKYYSEKGQALLFVVVALTVALIVVIGVSLRTLSTVSQISKTDTSSRLNAAAEGGAERFLNLPDSNLATLADGIVASECTSLLGGITFDSTRQSCVVTFDDSAGPDKITSMAYVTVLPYPNNSAQFAEFKLKKDEEVEVTWNKNASSVRLCWRDSSGSGGSKANLYYFGYGDSDSSQLKGGVCPPTGCAGSVGPSGWSGAVPVSDAFCVNKGYMYQYDVAGLASINGFRVRGLMSPADLMFVSLAGAFPQQGFQITSVSELSPASGVKESKVVRVYKSFPFLPALFDFGLFTLTGNLPK